MDLREKLIEILLQKPNKCTFEQLADFLISNGVTVQEWIPANEPPQESETCSAYIPFVTNADRIDSMTVKEKAKFFADTFCHGYGAYQIEEWLKQTAEEIDDGFERKVD